MGKDIIVTLYIHTHGIYGDSGQRQYPSAFVIVTKYLTKTDFLFDHGFSSWLAWVIAFTSLPANTSSQKAQQWKFSHYRADKKQTVEEKTEGRDQG